jgi:cytochrome c oxidase cbb3-type subunit III
MTNRKILKAMKKFKSFFLLLAGMFAALPTFAQTSESTWFANLQSMDSTQLTLLVILGIVLGVIVLLLVLMIYLMSFMSAVFKKENPEMASQPTWWDEFKIKYITGKMKPVGSKEEKELMKEHSYDGIVELDNHMPPWLANVFFLTIGIAVVYFMYYTVLGIGPTPTGRICRGAQDSCDRDRTIQKHLQSAILMKPPWCSTTRLQPSQQDRVSIAPTV